MRFRQSGRANQMRQNNQAETENDSPGRASEDKKTEARGSRGGCCDPPNLTRLQWSGRNARQFGWQPETRRGCKDQEAAQAPEQAFMPRYGIAPQRVDASQQQRESNGRQNVGCRRKDIALQPILGLPCGCAMLMFGVLMVGVFMRRRARL